MVLVACNSDKKENKVGRYLPLMGDGYTSGILDTETGNLYWINGKYFRDHKDYTEFIQPKPEKE